MARQHDRFGPPEAYGAPPRTGRFWFDFLAASAAIFISVVSLIIAIRGERTQRGLLAANSWPFVQLSEDHGLDSVSLDVENAGVGPAKIMTFEVFYDGRPVANAVDLLRICCGLAVPPPGTAPVPVGGLAFGEVFDNVLRPGEHILAMRLRKPATQGALFDRFDHAMTHLTFSTCYCSVLGECWTSRLRDLTQVAVRSCPVPLQQFVAGDGS